jgi:PAS domain S-box-containing protein
MEAKPARILIVEDDELIAHHIRRTLESLGYTVVGHTQRGDESLRLVEKYTPNLVLMDIQLDGPVTGIQAAAEIRRLFSIPIVFLTAFSDSETLEQVKDSGPYGYIVKPFTTQMLRSTIELAIYHHQAEARIQSLSRFPDEDPNPVMRISAEGILLYANRSSAPFIESWGCKPDEKIPPQWADWLSETLQGRTLVVELPCGERIFSCTWTPIPGANYANLYAFDVTARQHMEKRLSKSEERLRTVVENLPVIVFVIDQAGIFQLSEGKGLVQLGLRPGEVVGQSVYALYRSIPQIGENIRAALSGEKRDVTVEVAQRVFQCHFAPIIEAREEVSGVIAVLSDVTDLVVMEQAKREGEVRFRRLAEAGFEGLAFTRGGNFLQVNPQFAAMVGSTVEELVGQALIHFVTPEFRDMVTSHIQSESVEPFEYLALRQDGGIFPAEVQIRLIPNDGEMVQITAVHDLSQRKKTEASLRETQEKLNLALRASRMGIWDWDLLTDQVTGDEEVSAILKGERIPLDHPASEILNFTHPDDRQNVSDQFSQAGHTTDVPFEFEYRVIWPDTSQHTIAARGNVYRGEDRSGDHMIGVVWDVTERRAIEEEIRRLNSELEQRVTRRTAQMQTALRELEAFSYSVSHDLRAPLRAMNGFSRLLQEDYGKLLDEQGTHYLQRIGDSSQKMSQLIDNLLNLARYSRANLNVTVLNLSEMAQSAATELDLSDPTRRVTWVIADGISASGDEQLLRVVINNLLDNAWKFSGRTPSACIEFGLESQDGRPVYFVRDNGAGFNMEYVGRLFGAFQRLHDADEFEGSGIGLATVQRIIRRHGGDVWAEGEVGLGATFYFTLP